MDGPFIVDPVGGFRPTLASQDGLRPWLSPLAVVDFLRLWTLFLRTVSR